METVNTAEAAAFLAPHRPFDALEAGELEAVAAAAAEQRYAAGTTVLVEDGAPAEHLFVVRAGSMELLHQGEVVDVLMPGESFGHPSLLTGLAPAFTVRAAADSACLLIPREMALEVLSNRAGAGYVAATLRQWLVQAGHVVHALPELGTLQVGERPFSVLRDRCAGIALVTEDQLREALAVVWSRTKLVIEPTSALPIAAILAGAIPGRRIGVILSGGNVDAARVAGRL